MRLEVDGLIMFNFAMFVGFFLYVFVIFDLYIPLFVRPRASISGR